MLCVAALALWLGHALVLVPEHALEPGPDLPSQLEDNLEPVVWPLAATVPDSHQIL